jgi:hypothetical protein
MAEQGSADDPGERNVRGGATVPRVSIAEGYGDEHGDVHRVGTMPGCTCTREGWRDVAAAVLVHAGLQLATTDGRNRMLKILSDEWRAAVGRALAMSRHPAGSARRPVHLADRMDAAYRDRRRGQH